LKAPLPEQANFDAVEQVMKEHQNQSHSVVVHFVVGLMNLDEIRPLGITPAIQALSRAPLH